MTEAGTTFRHLRELARARAASLSGLVERGAFARALVAQAVRSFVAAIETAEGAAVPAPPLGDADFQAFTLESRDARLAYGIGQAASRLDDVAAGYQLGAVYTVALPEAERAALGVFYTPPALAERLLDMAERAGTDWASARVLDPACGGGSFLGPVAKRIRTALAGASADAIARHLARNLRGFEIDPFAAWLSQVLLCVSLRDVLRTARVSLPALIQVGDALARHEPRGPRFDLIVGNPPYGRIGRLAPDLRAAYARSLYGHANAYGLFTDLALRWTETGGAVAFVTPTSCLGGAYYQALRALLSREAPPVEVDLVLARRGVFDSVLQETMLACFRRGATAPVSVNLLVADEEGRSEVTALGAYRLASTEGAPWMLPRSPQQAALVGRLLGMRYRLKDYGWKVSTGPLVWNRHKPQFHDQAGPGRVPVVWAEAVSSAGKFRWRSERRTHRPWFALKLPADEWLVTRQPCVLVQRTTAKEQPRRLVAAELSHDFVARHGAVTVENHLNMVRPMNGSSRVLASTIAALLNSAVLDEAFRCISGSVAVSAAELEALPLPAPDDMELIQRLIAAGSSREKIEAAVRTAYGLSKVSDEPAAAA
jgi:adenine-specific DNA-methyltransferase